MNGKLELERRLADYYESEAPRRAPDWLLGRALDAIDSTPQRRSLARLPWSLPAWNGSARFAMTALAVAIVSVIGLSVLWPKLGGPGPAPPSSGPTATPGSTPFRVNVLFRVPFTYLFPFDAGYGFGPRTETFYEIRVPDSGGSGSSAWFLYIQAVVGARVEPCSPTSDPAALEGGPQGALDYLNGVPGVEITDETPLVIDGYPALSATIALDANAADCEELWVWASDDEPIPEPFREPGTVGRVTVIDVEGEPIVIYTWAFSRAGEWFPQADAIIESLDFEPAGAAPSGSPPSS